jgi:predicted nucleic acid-binding protein
VIVVDASMMIALLDERDAQHEKAVERLLELADQTLACSPMTLAEVLVGPARTGELEVARQVITELDIAKIPLAGGAAARLAVLRAGTNLKLPDRCVLLRRRTPVRRPCSHSTTG